MVLAAGLWDEIQAAVNLKLMRQIVMMRFLIRQQERQMIIMSSLSLASTLQRDLADKVCASNGYRDCVQILYVLTQSSRTFWSIIFCCILGSSGTSTAIIEGIDSSKRWIFFQPTSRSLIDKLVLETLSVIRTLVDNETEPPPSMTRYKENQFGIG